MAQTLAGSGEVGEDTLEQAGKDATALLVTAVTSTAAVPAYYAQVAAHLIDANTQQFGGKYTSALQGAFVRHGILSPAAARGVADGTSETSDPEPKPNQHASFTGDLPGGSSVGWPADPPSVSVPGQPYGLPDRLLVRAPVQRPRFAVAGAATSQGQLEAPAGEDVAVAFVEDLFRQGKVSVPAEYRHGFTAAALRTSPRTHEIHNNDEGLVLVRRFFD
jgi:hypothetical protein